MRWDHISRRDAVAAAVLVVSIAAGLVLLQRQSGDLSVQAQLNLRFAERPIGVAFEKYPRLRPPLYPLVLWGAARVGVPPSAVQGLALVSLLALVFMAARRQLVHVHPAWVVAGFALAHWNHVNLHQPTAESLFAPLLLAFALLLSAHARRADARTAAALAVVTSLLCLTRYFGLSLCVPLALGAVLAAPAPGRQRMTRALAVLAVALLPVGVWMWVTYEQTGFFTGTDRTRERVLPESAQHWAELTGPDDHLRLMAKTVFVDFLSTTRYAAHAVVTRPYDLPPAEGALLVLVLLALASLGWVWWRSQQAEAGPPSPTGAVAEDAGPQGAALMLARPPAAIALVLAAYAGLTLGVWMAGNNDPLYTRFLFPAYPLLWLALFHAYDGLRARGATAVQRLPWQALYAAFVVLHALRSWRAESLPVRYLW